MNGISDDIRAAARQAAAGTVSENYARDQVEGGERWLDGLGARRNLGAYQDEIIDVKEALTKLRAAIRVRWPNTIRLLWIPDRNTKAIYLTKEEALANVGALLHRRAAAPRLGDGPMPREELIAARPLSKKSIEVLRLGQGWVDRRGRARVETAYELLIGGERACTGSRRYIMRQADWATMCDVFGQLPPMELVRGLAKRRALYKARRDKRRAQRRRGRARWPLTTELVMTAWGGAARPARARHGGRRAKAIMRWAKPVGEALATRLWADITSPALFPKLLTRTPVK